MGEGKNARVVYRTCHLCEAMCGLRMTVRDGAISEVRGDPRDPLSRGYLCPKGPALKELHEDPDRLRTPLQKTKGGHRPISWEDALEACAEGLHQVQLDKGRNGLGVYIGNPAVHNHGLLLYGPNFLRFLRTKRRFSATSADQLPHMLASYLMFGHQLLLPIPDIDRTDYLLMLGANPYASNGSLMSAPDFPARMAALQARGGRWVVLDPRRSESAKKADEHHFIRPATDAVFLFGLLRAIIKDGGLRLGHLGPYCKHQEALGALAEPFHPALVEEITGVSAKALLDIAKELGSRPKAVVYGRMGVSTQDFGLLCQWLINVINLASGNFDREGGALFTAPALDAIGLPGGLGAGRGSFGRWHSHRRKLPEFGGELPVAALLEELGAPPGEEMAGLLTIAGNPVLSTPNGSALDTAFSKLQFMASIDFYLNETTRHAHIILPPTSPLERPHFDVIFHLLAVRNTVKYSPAVFDKPSDALHDWQILVELQDRIARKRGNQPLGARMTQAAVGKAGPERLLDMSLRLGPYGTGKRGLSIVQLKQAPHGVDLGPLKPSCPERLALGKGHIDLAPQQVCDDVPRLRNQIRQWQKEGSERPFALIGRRHLRSNNSWMHNAPKLSAGKDRCTLLINPADAARLGLADGEQAQVKSAVAERTCTLEVSAEMMPGTVSLPHGFGHHRPGIRLGVASERPGVSINDLSDHERVDLASGNAAFSGTPVSIHKLSPPAE